MGPLGDDVADDLSPFAAGVHASEGDHPTCPRDEQNDGEGVLAQEFDHGRFDFIFWLFAIRGSLFIKVFGEDDGDEDARPVGDGVAEE